MPWRDKCNHVSSGKLNQYFHSWKSFSGRVFFHAASAHVLVRRKCRCTAGSGTVTRKESNIDDSQDEKKRLGSSSEDRQYTTRIRCKKQDF